MDVKIRQIMRWTRSNPCSKPTASPIRREFIMIVWHNDFKNQHSWNFAVTWNGNRAIVRSWFVFHANPLKFIQFAIRRCQINKFIKLPSIHWPRKIRFNSNSVIQKWTAIIQQSVSDVNHYFIHFLAAANAPRRCRRQTIQLTLTNQLILLWRKHSSVLDSRWSWAKEGERRRERAEENIAKSVSDRVRIVVDSRRGAYHSFARTHGHTHTQSDMNNTIAICLAH